jgi:phage tail-like protein
MLGPARHDPFTGFNFRVEIDGVTAAAFAECTGIGSETDVIEYREGGDRTLGVRKIPSLTHYSNVVLRRGITTNRDLWDWRQTVIDGQVSRRTVAITLLDDTGAPVMRWTLRDAWPVKLEGPSLNARGNDVALESIELTHEGLRLEA